MADDVAPTGQGDAKPQLYTSVSTHIQNWIPIVAINECLTGLGLLGYFGQASCGWSGRRGAGRPVNQLHPDVSLERSEGCLRYHIAERTQLSPWQKLSRGKTFPRTERQAPTMIRTNKWRKLLVVSATILLSALIAAPLVHADDQLTYANDLTVIGLTGAGRLVSFQSSSPRYRRSLAV